MRSICVRVEDSLHRDVQRYLIENNKSLTDFIKDLIKREVYNTDNNKLVQENKELKKKLNEIYKICTK